MKSVQEIEFRDLGRMPYQAAWDYQEALLKANVEIKRRKAGGEAVDTCHYLLFVEHPPVYTLGRSGKEEHRLISDAALAEKGIEFAHTNRGGDITFHGPGQLVGYPILDLEHFYTDIGKYLRSLEEVVIRTLADYGLKGERSAGETGVWLEPGSKGRERKICAMGIRCSRWVTMHGFALNINTNLDYFNYIIPCGIHDKKVSSMQQEIGYAIPEDEVRARLVQHFEAVFSVHFSGLPQSLLSLPDKR